MSEPLRLSPKAPRVDGSGAMFDRIAGRYDLLNRILSLGRDGAWRRRAVRALELRPGRRYLDVATGTADVAIEIGRVESTARIDGIDPASEMLAEGRAKIERRQRLRGRIELHRGGIEQLPFADGTFDGAIIAFGIRNVVDRRGGLREMTRVVRPGARVVVLELTEPTRGWVAPLARLYVRHLVPRLGGLLAREPEYRYLQESIAAFPPPGTFLDLMREAGLVETSAAPLTFGVCHLFVGRRPRAGSGEAK